MRMAAKANVPAMPWAARVCRKMRGSVSLLSTTTPCVMLVTPGTAVVTGILALVITGAANVVPLPLPFVVIALDNNIEFIIMFRFIA